MSATEGLFVLYEVRMVTVFHGFPSIVDCAGGRGKILFIEPDDANYHHEKHEYGGEVREKEYSLVLHFFLPWL